MTFNVSKSKVEAKEVQDGGVQVVDVDFVASYIEAEVIGFTEAESGLHSTACGLAAT